MTEHGAKPHTLDQHLNEPMSGVGKDETPAEIPPAHKGESDMSKAQNVEKAAKANTTAAARKQYGKTDAANAALKAATTPRAAGRRVPVTAPPAAAQPAAGRREGVPDVKPPAQDPHSYGALDTNPPEAAAEVRKVEERKARGEKPEPEETPRKSRKGRKRSR